MAEDWKTEFRSQAEVAEARKRGRYDFSNCTFLNYGSASWLHCMDLGGCDFRGADLHNQILLKANLTQCDFRGAQLDGINIKDANLEGARFDPHIVPQLVAAVTLGVRISDPGPDDNRFNRC